jgi:hypothetical protein
MGTKGTLILESEQETMLFSDRGVSTSVQVTGDKGKEPSLATTDSTSPIAAAAKTAAEGGPISRGYTEVIEHWAWCIRNRSSDDPKPEATPRCHPKVAMADAIIALVSNMAIKDKIRIEFKPEWFEIESDETPEGVKPDVSRYA